MTTVLIIDDDIALLGRLSTQLGEAGYHVLKSSEITAAETLWDEQRPDLVLLEVKTGRGAGWRLLEQVAPHTPVIVVSAEGREEETVRGLEAGALDYVAKPYRSNELLARIRLRLNGRAAALKPSPAAAAAPEEAPPEPAAASAEKPEDTSVFMTETEEMALLREETSVPQEPAPEPDDQTDLGEALRTERQRRRITLVQAENELHIRMWYLQAMEEGRYTLLPRGPMAEQMLRSYASYLDMSLPWVLEQYQQHHSTNQIEPPQVFGESERRFEVPRWLIWAAAVVLALTVSGAALLLIDPGGVEALGENLRGLMTFESETPVPAAEPSATPTVSPASSTATPTAQPMPTSTATPAPLPTATPLTPNVDGPRPD